LSFVDGSGVKLSLVVALLVLTAVFLTAVTGAPADAMTIFGLLCL